MTGIKRRLVINYLIITFIIVFFIEGFFIFFAKNYYYGQIEQNLKNKVNVTTGFFSRYLGDVMYPSQNMKSIIEDYSDRETSELQVITPQGDVILTSSGFTQKDKISTKDYLSAIDGKTATWVGANPLTGEKIMAVSGPIKSGSWVTGVLRCVTSLEKTDHMIKRLIFDSFLVIGVIIILMAATSIILSKSIIDPLNEINKVAKKMASGLFTERIDKKYNDEIGELAETINYMAAEISKVDQMKNDFISSISHELRTPLTAIRGWGETILTGGLKDREEAKKGLEIIIRETARLTQMVEQLLDFSRLEGGRLQLQISKVDVRRELEDIIDVFRVRAKKGGLNLEYYFQENIPKTLGDKDRLRQVFINILDNAVKFSNRRGEIFVYLRGDQGNIYIQVKDQGIGISPDEISKIKQKFYKGKSPKAGSGIGLGICDEIIKLHQGHLDIESEVGKGTSVKITLPIDVLEKDQSSNRSSTKS